MFSQEVNAGGLLKEMGQCVKGVWEREGGGVEEGGLALCARAESLFKAVQWSQSAFCLLI